MRNLIYSETGICQYDDFSLVAFVILCSSKAMSIPDRHSQRLVKQHLG